MNDTLLIKMIEKQMQAKGIAHFQLFDNVVVQPKVIKVKADEVVFIYFVNIQSQKDFEINLVSATGVVKYSDKNMNGNFESTLVTPHWSNVKVNLNNIRLNNYFIRYVKVVFQPK